MSQIISKSPGEKIGETMSLLGVHWYPVSTEYTHTYIIIYHPYLYLYLYLRYIYIDRYLYLRYRWLKAPIFTNNGKLQQPCSQQIRFQGFFLARCNRSWLHRSHRWLTASFLDLRWSPRQKTWEHSIFLDWSLHFSYTWNRSCVADHSYLKWCVHKCGTQKSGDRDHFPLSNGNFRGPYNSKWCTSAPLQSPPLWIRRRPWPSGPVFKEWNYGICGDGSKPITAIFWGINRHKPSI